MLIFRLLEVLMATNWNGFESQPGFVEGISILSSGRTGRDRLVLLVEVASASAGGICPNRSQKGA